MSRVMNFLFETVSFVALCIVIGVPGFMLVDTMKDHFGTFWAYAFVFSVILLCAERLMQITLKLIVDDVYSQETQP